MKKHVPVLTASAFVLTFGGIGASAEEGHGMRGHGSPHDVARLWHHETRRPDGARSRYALRLRSDGQRW
jgi:hypothetical protein